MTEGNQPPNSRGKGSAADQDTTTLPRLSSPPSGNGSTAGNGSSSGGWSPTVTRAAGETDNGATPIGAKVAAAAAAGAPAAPTKTASKKAADPEPKAARAPRNSARAGRQPRRARLTLSHVNVYSVFKFSCVLAIALFFVWLIMIGVLYGVLDAAGVFDKINTAWHTINGDGKTNNVVTGTVVFGVAAIIGVVNIVLFIAMSTIGAMIYNLCADLVGGAELTLSERD